MANKKIDIKPTQEVKDYKLYICTKTCFCHNRLFQRGEILEFSTDLKLPPHFKIYDDEYSRKAYTDPALTTENVLAGIGLTKAQAGIL